LEEDSPEESARPAIVSQPQRQDVDEQADRRLQGHRWLQARPTQATQMMIILVVIGFCLIVWFVWWLLDRMD
jgi:hypothetical protein